MMVTGYHTVRATVLEPRVFASFKVFGYTFLFSALLCLLKTLMLASTSTFSIL